MNDNNVKSKSVLKISYDDKKDLIKARVETNAVNEQGLKEKVLYTCEGIDAVNYAIKEFVYGNKGNLFDLVSNGSVKMDDNSSIRYGFDYSNDALYERRLTRADWKKIKGITIDEPKETVEVKEPVVENKIILNKSISKNELVNSIIALNPYADIKVSMDEDGNIEYISSNVSGDKLALPENFYYNDKNGITNKHKTLNGEYISLDVFPLEKELEDDLEELEESDDIEVEDVEESEVVESKETKKKDKKKDKKGIKRLKIYGALAALVAAGIIGYSLRGGVNDTLNNNNNYSDDNTRSNTYSDESNITYVSDEDVISENMYDAYGSAITFNDMETQIQSINDICFGYEPCALYNFVASRDRDAVEAIINMRNRIFYEANGNTSYDNNYEAKAFLNNIVNYVFENGNIIDGQVIKTFDSLSPYAQYIVIASSQSILQRCVSYNHTTNRYEYDYDVLTIAFNECINSTYRELTNQNGKTI